MPKERLLTADRRFPPSTGRAGTVTGSLLLPSGDKVLLPSGDDILVSIDAQPYKLRARSRSVVLSTQQRFPKDIERTLPTGSLTLHDGTPLLLTDGVTELALDETKTRYLLTA